MPPTTQKPTHHISRGLVLIMAAACGIAVANLYYAQPLLHRIAQVYHTSEAATGWVVTASQIGFAAGLLFLLPAGARSIGWRRTPAAG